MSQNIDESLGPGDIFWVLERNMKNFWLQFFFKQKWFMGLSKGLLFNLQGKMNSVWETEINIKRDAVYQIQSKNI